METNSRRPEACFARNQHAANIAASVIPRSTVPARSGVNTSRMTKAPSAIAASMQIHQNVSTNPASFLMNFVFSVCFKTVPPSLSSFYVA